LTGNQPDPTVEPWRKLKEAEKAVNAMCLQVAIKQWRLTITWEDVCRGNVKCSLIHCSHLRVRFLRYPLPRHSGV